MSETASKKAAAEKQKPNYKYLRDKDREPVKGIFRFYEAPGGNLSFSFKKWPQDQVENYSFNDGQIYTIPLGVAKHLNKEGWYPVHDYKMDESGKHVQKISQRVRRFGFQSLEFVDIEDLSQSNGSIITVETTTAI
jgi:hypothetical protein